MVLDILILTLSLGLLILVDIRLRLGLFLVGPILLSYLVLHHVDRVLFKLLSDLFFLALPLVLNPM